MSRYNGIFLRIENINNYQLNYVVELPN